MITKGFMKALPENLKIQRKIGQILDKHMASQKTYVEIRSNELYELVIRSEDLFLIFPNQKIFNQFLRESHQNNSLGTFIGYRVDDSDFRNYRWHFRRKNR